MPDEKIVIYQTPDGRTSIDVSLDLDTVWLSQAQIVQLFDSSKANISEHIKRIYRSGELGKKSTVRDFRTVQQEGKRRIIRKLQQYNLDMILSVGYRINSKRGTQFRIWANQILKDYLVKGFAANEKRLTALKQTIKLMGSVMDANQLSNDEAAGLLKVLTDYTYALDVLDKYDHRKLKIEATHIRKGFIATYDEAKKAIAGLKKKFGGSRLFAKEKDESFKSSIATIYQSFDGKELYPSIEEKAANLLYFITKNHSFSDGNKRIAAFLFVWFLARNILLYRSDGSKRIADNTLVALTLMIAQSKPEEKEIIIQVVVNLINNRND